jgi:hypothetical protein
MYNKIVERFKVIRKELYNLIVLRENTYIIDETGIVLNVPGSLKVLVDKDDRQNYRDTRVKHTMVTAIECISTDDRSFFSLII